MPRIKTILCSGIGILYITALTAQSVPKNKTLTNVVAYQVYQQKQWNMKHLPKNSVLYQYNSRYVLQSSLLSNANLHLPLINISVIPTVPHLSMSEKIQSHLEKISSQYYMPIQNFSCWGPTTIRKISLGSDFLKKEKASLDERMRF